MFVLTAIPGHRLHAVWLLTADRKASIPSHLACFSGVLQADAISHEGAREKEAPGVSVGMAMTIGRASWSIRARRMCTVRMGVEVPGITTSRSFTLVVHIETDEGNSLRARGLLNVSQKRIG